MKRQLQLHFQQRWHRQNSQFTFTASKTKAASEHPQIHAFSYVFSASTKFSVYIDSIKDNSYIRGFTTISVYICSKLNCFISVLTKLSVYITIAFFYGKFLEYEHNTLVIFLILSPRSANLPLKLQNYPSQSVHYLYSGPLCSSFHQFSSAPKQNLCNYLLSHLPSFDYILHNGY